MLSLYVKNVYLLSVCMSTGVPMVRSPALHQRAAPRVCFLLCAGQLSADETAEASYNLLGRDYFE